jgi:hypothetical protein
MENTLYGPSFVPLPVLCSRSTSVSVNGCYFRCKSLVKGRFQQLYAVSGGSPPRMEKNRWTVCPPCHHEAVRRNGHRVIRELEENRERRVLLQRFLCLSCGHSYTVRPRPRLRYGEAFAMGVNPTTWPARQRSRRLRLLWQMSGR